MYRNKTANAFLAVLTLLTLTGPVLAEPSPNQTSVVPTVNSLTTSTNQSSIGAVGENTATIIDPGLEQALAEAEMAVRQTQAERVRQELDRLGDDLERLNTEYLAETNKLAEIEQALNDARDRLRWAEAEFEAQREILNGRIADIYKQGQVEPINAIINNSSFSEFFTRVSFLLKLGKQDAQLLQELRDKQVRIEEVKKSLDQLYAQQKEITAELEGRKKAIEEKIRQETYLLASIDAETKAILDREAAEERQKQAEIVKQLIKKSQNKTSDVLQSGLEVASNYTNNSSSGKISLEPGSIGLEAIKYLGIPYVWGGEDPSIGLDCSGLVKVVFSKFGVDLPHFSRAQATLGIPVDYNDLQSGDLVFFGNPIHHVGIYLGEGYYIHAPKRNDVVKISKLSDRNDYVCARRIITIVSSTMSAPLLTP